MSVVELLKRVVFWDESVLLCWTLSPSSTSLFTRLNYTSVTGLVPHTAGGVHAERIRAHQVHSTTRMLRD